MVLIKGESKNYIGQSEAFTSCHLPVASELNHVHDVRQRDSGAGQTYGRIEWD